MIVFKHILAFSLVVLLSGLNPLQTPLQTPANENKLRINHFNIERSGLALQGYDPISYFLGKPQIGASNFSTIHKGIQYRFVSAKNLELFNNSPEKFEPAYGGWCAYAMGASGEKVEVDPKTFKIIDGKLYLFYNAFFNNTLTKWNENEQILHKKADLNWQLLYR